jgi:hypothetical protein
MLKKSFRCIRDPRSLRLREVRLVSIQGNRVGVLETSDLPQEDLSPLTWRALDLCLKVFETLDCLEQERPILEECR